MMELLVVKGEATEVLEVEDDDKTLLHGTKVMLSLLKGWSDNFYTKRTSVKSG